MRIALPMSEGRLSGHFGRCDTFLMIDVDPETRSVVQRQEVAAPPHQPGLLPRWLSQRGATVILAGGMGHRALELFEAEGIDVVVGVSGDSPELIVENYLSGTLRAGGNVCDH